MEQQTKQNLPLWTRDFTIITIGSIFLLVCEIIGIIRALKGRGAYLPFVKGLPVIIK